MRHIFIQLLNGSGWVVGGWHQNYHEMSLTTVMSSKENIELYLEHARNSIVIKLVFFVFNKQSSKPVITTVVLCIKFLLFFWHDQKPTLMRCQCIYIYLVPLPECCFDLRFTHIFHPSQMLTSVKCTHRLKDSDSFGFGNIVSPLCSINKCKYNGIIPEHESIQLLLVVEWLPIYQSRFNMYFLSISQN